MDNQAKVQDVVCFDEASKLSKDVSEWLYLAEQAEDKLKKTLYRSGRTLLSHLMWESMVSKREGNGFDNNGKTLTINRNTWQVLYYYLSENGKTQEDIQQGIDFIGGLLPTEVAYRVPKVEESKKKAEELQEVAVQ